MGISGWQIKPNAVSINHLAEELRNLLTRLTAQAEELEQQVATLTGHVEERLNGLEAVQEERAAVMQQLAEMQEQVNSLTGRAAALESAVLELEGKSELQQASVNELLNRAAELEAGLAQLTEQVQSLGTGGGAPEDPIWLDPGSYTMQGTVLVLKAKLNAYGSLKVFADEELIAEYLENPGTYAFNPVGIGYVVNELRVEGPGQALIRRIG